MASLTKTERELIYILLDALFASVWKALGRKASMENIRSLEKLIGNDILASYLMDSVNRCQRKGLIGSR